MESIKYSEKFVINSLSGKILQKDKEIDCETAVDLYDKDQSAWIDEKVFCSDDCQLSIDNMKTLELIESMRMRRKYKMSLL